MVTVQDQSAVSGKRLIPQLAVGCLLFAALLGFGTYFLGKLTTPYFIKKNEEYLRTHRPPANEQVPTSTPPVTR